MGATKNGAYIKVTGVGNTLATITSDINDVTWIEEAPAGTWTVKSKGFKLMDGCIFTMGNPGDFSVAEILKFTNTAHQQCIVYHYPGAKWYIYGACELWQTQDVTYYNQWYMYGKFHIEGNDTFKPVMENFYAPNWYQQYEVNEDDFNVFEKMLFQNGRPNGRFWTYTNTRRLREFGIENIKNSTVKGIGGTSYGAYGIGNSSGGDDGCKLTWENVIFDGWGMAVFLSGQNGYFKNCQFMNNATRGADFISAPAILPGEYDSENAKIARSMGQFGFTFLDGCDFPDAPGGEDIYMNDNSLLLIRDCDFKCAVNSVDVRYHAFLWVWTGNTHVAAIPYGLSGGRCFWVHGLDLTIEDQGGNPIEDAMILVRQKDGKEFWSFRTDANGKPKTAGCLEGKILCIWREQLDNVPNFTYWSDASNSTYHKVWVWKEGYGAAKYDFVMSQNRAQTIQLEDALTAPDVRDSVPMGLGLLGELDLPVIADVEKGVEYDSTTKTGTFKKPAVGDVRDGEGYGAGDVEFEGLLDLPVIADVEKGVQFDQTTKTGTFKAPPAADVRDGEGYGAGDVEFEGELDLPDIEDVRRGIKYDSETKTGDLLLPAASDVRKAVEYGGGGDEFLGTAAIPGQADVREGVDVDVSDVGDLDLPAIGDVEKDVQFDNETKTGIFKVPIPAQVLKDVLYGAAGTEFTGSLVGANIFKADAIGKLQQRVSMKGIFREGG